MIEIKETNLNGVLLRTNTFAYDLKKRLAATTYGAVGQTYRPIYEKNTSGYEYPDDVVVGIKLDGKFTDQTTKDGLGRVSTRTLTVENSPLLTENYSYLKTSLASGKTIETAIVAGTTGQIGSTSANTSYTYDISGNIETVTVDSVLVAKYHYDKWNRIIREDNHKFGKTYTWEYDIGGNITEKRTYALCTGDAVSGEYTSDTYEYATSGWKDQLTSFNGEVCEYDALGNPTTYRGKTLEWTKVRRLAKFGDVEFTYNANGLRTSKNVSGVTHSYLWDGNKLFKETFSNGSAIIYYYGEDGVIGFNYGGIDYYYRKNIQGDILGVFTSSGAIVAKYAYDAWGNHKIYDANNIEVTSVSHIGVINPFRYRGYYFDAENSLYYVKERYYDSQSGRWLNADKAIALIGDDIRGYNQFSYCFNNPINMGDKSGCWPKWLQNIVDTVVESVNTVVNAVVDCVESVSTTISNVVNASSHDANKRPYRGEPGSTYQAPNGDTRTYGPDGTPEHDYDHDDHGNPKNHPHDENGGHNHDWNDGVRGPAYSINWDVVGGVALVAVCAIGIAVVAADDATGIGVANDFLLGPLGAGVSRGMILIFG